ncbi:hypothetical protein OCL06_07835 [Alteromonas sp. ASW11-19]|uniref:Porin n=1 Tax=Alteromonas salexigens TaxID=2982530 RepID=A0ABT2VMG4_9ALTE|nr:hypothetical protein [Alteromonas salexigens]MCU7554506.1 hypothetical protein [Alteromonas salexigens]
MRLVVWWSLALASGIGMVSSAAGAAFDALTVDPFASVLLRYENDINTTGVVDRERVRLVGHAGVQGQLLPSWHYRVRLSTGLKNQQNVPAMTVYRFTDQPSPDADVYVSQAYAEYQQDTTRVRLGKLPWQLNNVTDVFWDRDLNPIGVSGQFKVTDRFSVIGMAVAPLDGNANTVGELAALQGVLTGREGNWQWQLAPWLVHYTGDAQCRFACRDTDIAHTSLRLSAYLQHHSWRVGLDAGYALALPDEVTDASRDDRSSVALEARYGALKVANDWQAYIRLLRVERHGVIAEFAQNATGRLTTHNYRGLDMRARYALQDHWWWGARFSYLQLLEGPDAQAVRLRVETQYRW